MLVETNNVDEFLTDAIFQIIKVVEVGSSYTQNYNVTGMTLLLKSNQQFMNLSKQLMIKYGCYSRVPPEYEMIMIISTTAYICAGKNKRKAQLQEYLNTPVDTLPKQSPDIV